MRLKIYLDDERPTPEGYTHRCYGPEEVIALLQQAEKDGDIVELISLDHDLGEFNREHNRTGYDVLTWLEEQVHTRGFIPPRTVAIHSANPSAKEKMRAARYAIYQKAEELGIDWRR